MALTAHQMARELGFAHATHGDLASLEEWSFDWKAFVLKEELIRSVLPDGPTD